MKAAVDGKAAISSWPVQLPSRVSGGQVEGPVAAQRSLEELKGEVAQLREARFASPPTGADVRSADARAWLDAAREAIGTVRSREGEINAVVEAFGFEVCEIATLELRSNTPSHPNPPAS